MMLEFSQSTGMKCFIFFMTSLLMAGFSACGSTPKMKQVQEVSGPNTETSSDMTAWKDGLQALQEQDYVRAMRIFENLSLNAENSSLRVKALYALACVRLALASSSDELNSAMVLWDSWTQQPSSGTYGEDPRMLTPFLQQTAQLLTAGTGFSKALNREEKVGYKDSFGSKDIAAYKSLLQARDKELERVKSKLSAREKEVRHLKSQLDSLEAIHLKIQEKKKETSSP